LRCASAFGLTGALGRWAQAVSTGELEAGSSAGDYEALVCVFLFGGNDGNNTVVPLDARHADDARGRGPALALPRESLLPLPDADGAAAYGLRPALAPLLPLWTGGRLALQFNTGALIEPLTRDAWLRAGARPDSLFSHSDQQEFAQGLQDGAASSRSGWGFRLAASSRTHLASPINCASARPLRWARSLSSRRARTTVPTPWRTTSRCCWTRPSATLESAVIEQTLTHMGSQARATPRAPARGQLQHAA